MELLENKTVQYNNLEELEEHELPFKLPVKLTVSIFLSSLKSS
jgi:hypothetical protein